MGGEGGGGRLLSRSLSFLPLILYLPFFSNLEKSRLSASLWSRTADEMTPGRTDREAFCCTELELNSHDVARPPRHQIDRCGAAGGGGGGGV